MFKDIIKLNDFLLDFALLVSSSYFFSFLIFGCFLKIKNWDIVFVSLLCITLALNYPYERSPKKIKRMMKIPGNYLRKIINISGSLIVILSFLNLYLKILPSLNFKVEINKLELMLNSVFIENLALVVFLLLSIRLSKFISNKITQKTTAFIINILVIIGLFFVVIMLFSFASKFFLALSLFSLHVSYLVNELIRLFNVQSDKENIASES